MDFRDKLFCDDKINDVYKDYKYQLYIDYTMEFFNEVRNNIYETYLSNTDVKDINYIAGATYFVNIYALRDLCKHSSIKCQKAISDNIYGTYKFYTKVPRKSKVKSLFRK